MYAKEQALLILIIQTILFTLLFLLRIYTITNSYKEMLKYFIPIYGLKYWKYILSDDKN